MSPPLLACLGIALLAALAGLVYTVSKRKAAHATPEPLPDPADEDDPYTARFVAPRTPQEVVEAPPEEVPDPIVWSEQDDVYRPIPVDAGPFVASLALKRIPEIRAGQTGLFLRRSVHEKVLTHLKTDLAVERGGLLLGQVYVDRELNCFLLLILEALPADEGVETPTSFTYTSESWQALTPRLQQMDPTWTVLGSYHSHPGMGVFLSSTDLNTQKEVFAQEWQVALVVDPVSDQVGFFVGESGKPCPNWYFLE